MNKDTRSRLQSKIKKESHIGEGTPDVLAYGLVKYNPGFKDSFDRYITVRCFHCVALINTEKDPLLVCMNCCFTFYCETFCAVYDRHSTTCTNVFQRQMIMRTISDDKEIEDPWATKAVNSIIPNLLENDCYEYVRACRQFEIISPTKTGPGILLVYKVGKKRTTYKYVFGRDIVGKENEFGISSDPNETKHMIHQLRLFHFQKETIIVRYEDTNFNRVVCYCYMMNWGSKERSVVAYGQWEKIDVSNKSE